MAFTEVPLVDNLGPYLDSLLEELSKNDAVANITDHLVTIGTQTEEHQESDESEAEEVSNKRVAIVQISGGDEYDGLFKEDQGKEEEGIINCTKPFYLENHLNLMCYFALCRIKGGGDFQDSICHKGLLFVVNILALVQALSVFKDYVLGYAKGGSVFHYITAWYFFHTFVVSCWFLKLLVNGENIPSLIQNIRLLLDKRVDQSQPFHKKMSKMVTGIAVLSILSAFAFAFDIFFINYDFKQMVEVRSVDLSKAILLWTRANYSEHEEELGGHFGNFNARSLTLGCIGILIQFVGWLQYFMIRDIMLMAALTLYSHAEAYKAFLTAIKQLDLNSLGAIWRNYELLHKMSSEIETCFGKLFQLIHIDNWLCCAYFLYIYVDPTEIEPIGFVVNLVVVIKIGVMYCLSAKANNATGNTLSRLHIKSSHVGKREDSDLKQDILYLEQKIKVSPVGIGSGNFLVHENFPFKFLGSVASSFLFFLKSESETQD